MNQLKEKEIQCQSCRAIYNKTTWSKCPTCRTANPEIDNYFDEILPAVSSGTPMPAVRKPLNPLAQSMQEMCCGTTCDKQNLIQRINELEDKCKDLDNIDDRNATFDEKLEEKLKSVFMAAIRSYSERMDTEAEFESEWLNFKVEQGL